MQAYRTEKILTKNGELFLDNLPLYANDKVEIIILFKQNQKKKEDYPLKGKLVEYDDPFEPVANEDWSVLN